MKLACTNSLRNFLKWTYNYYISLYIETKEIPAFLTKPIDIYRVVLR